MWNIILLYWEIPEFYEIKVKRVLLCLVKLIPRNEIPEAQFTVCKWEGNQFNFSGTRMTSDLDTGYLSIRWYFILNHELELSEK